MANKKKTTNPIELAPINSGSTQNFVKFKDVQLVRSMLQPTKGDQDNSLAFALHLWVEDFVASCLLRVKTNHSQLNEDEYSTDYFNLDFEICGDFIPDPEIPRKKIAEFLYWNSLAILWPYAREYATDQSKRAGMREFDFPIINPQEMTAQLVKDNLIVARFLGEDDSVVDWEPEKRPKKKRQ